MGNYMGLKGLDKYLAMVKGHVKEVDRKVKHAVKEGTALLLRLVRRYVPADVGHLRESIMQHVEMLAQGARGAVFTQMRTPDGKYLLGALLEYGTKTKTIYPKEKTFLLFPFKGGGAGEGGNWVFSKGPIERGGIKVGTPESPRMGWIRAREGRGTRQWRSQQAVNFHQAGEGQRMPWLRSAWHDVEPQIMDLLREAAYG